MNCFHHQNRVAVATCKSCGKGLCSDCAAEVPNGIACKNRCEERVRWLNEMVDQSARIRAVANKQVLRSGMFVGLIGALVLIFASLIYAENEFAAYCLGGFGVFFLIYGFSQVFAGRYPRLKAPPLKDEA